MILIDKCWCCGADVERTWNEFDDKQFEPIYCSRCLEERRDK